MQQGLFSKMVPKIFVINLARDVERMQNMQAQLDGLGLQFERIEAFDGRNLDSARQRDLYSNFWFCFFHGRPASRGEIGCAMSHRNIYRKMVEEGISWAILLEDDVVIEHVFNDAIENIESETRAFDMVQLFSFRKPDRKFKMMNSSPFAIATYKNRHASTAAYVIRLSGAKKC
jgi:glycosyl transferase, family 25